MCCILSGGREEKALTRKKQHLALVSVEVYSCLLETYSALLESDSLK